MRKLLLTLLLVCGVVNLTFGQICPYLDDLIKIENQADVPTVTTNGDGTVTLSHPDPLINNVFQGYEITQFFPTFPGSSNSEQRKFYTIRYNSKQLLQDIIATIPSARFWTTSYESISEIDSTLINYVDGKEFNLIGWSFGTDLDPCDYDCPFNMASQNFETTISFEYDMVTKMLNMQTIAPTSCVYQLSLEFAGPTEDTTGGGSSLSSLIQTWQINSGNSGAGSQSQECGQFEYILASLLEVACNNGETFGQTEFTILSDTGELIFKKGNVLMGENAILLRDASLSIDENQLNQVLVFEADNNPYLQVKNGSELTLNLQIFDLNGRKVIGSTALINNSINISALQKGTLYLITLTNTFGYRNTIKFVKR